MQWMWLIIHARFAFDICLKKGPLVLPAEKKYDVFLIAWYKNNDNDNDIWNEKKTITAVIWRHQINFIINIIFLHQQNIDCYQICLHNRL